MISLLKPDLKSLVWLALGAFVLPKVMSMISSRG